LEVGIRDAAGVGSFGSRGRSGPFGLRIAWVRSRSSAGSRVHSDPAALGFVRVSRCLGSFGFARDGACASILARGTRRRAWSAQAPARGPPLLLMEHPEVWGNQTASLHDHRISHQPILPAAVAATP
jgi:hypothetical protein